MTQHEQPKSKAAEQMQFAGDFDTGLTMDEKLEAAVKFDDLVQSTLFRFAKFTDNFNHNAVSGDGSLSSLLLAIPQEDGSFVSVAVESKSLDDGTKRRKIVIQEMYDNRGRGLHRYYIEDDQVLRYDNIRQAVLSDGLSTVLSAEGLRRNIAIVKNEAKNSELEQQMGINKQPVGVDEISKLAELLESAQPRFL